jgi:CTP synthase
LAKYIIVAGGVISGTGKGVSAASIGLLLKLRGHSVQFIKFDPYLNVNAGVLAPREHGECFLCDDGTETDLDLGHYERIAGVTVSSKNILTSGTLFKELIDEQEKGKWLGETIQIIPHATDKIQERLEALGEVADVVIAEIGGTVGDIESRQFYEAVRQFRQKHGEDVMIVLVAPVLWVPTIKEWKTKPFQNSVKELQSYGLYPDVLFCRGEHKIPDKIIEKVSKTTGVGASFVFQAPDVNSIYQVPLVFYDNQVDDLIVDKFRLKRSYCHIKKYRDLVERQNAVLPEINIGIFGKYENCDEAYISLKEALSHSGLANGVKVKIGWVKAEELEAAKEIAPFFSNLDGIIIPGGFDKRGIEGKVKAIKYVRENKIPFLGICLGLQCAVIEFSRNVCGHCDANSLEFDKNTANPVVHFIEGQEKVEKKSGTMRLGAYDCDLVKGSLAFELYGKKVISERHRHRYEVNEKYVSGFELNGFKVTGRNPQSQLVEIMELDKVIHPYFIGTQAHPEFKSKLMDASPLFRGLVAAALQFRRPERDPELNNE